MAEVLTSIPVQITRLHMHIYILDLTKGNRESERQTFLELLLRSENVVLDTVEMDEETGEGIYELGEKGLLRKISKP